jgi:hypothetical protein
MGKFSIKYRFRPLFDLANNICCIELVDIDYSFVAGMMSHLTRINNFRFFLSSFKIWKLVSNMGCVLFFDSRTICCFELVDIGYKFCYIMLMSHLTRINNFCFFFGSLRYGKNLSIKYGFVLFWLANNILTSVGIVVLSIVCRCRTSRIN